MARSPDPLPTVAKKDLSAEGIQRGIGRLQQRIDELERFSTATVGDGSSPELTALSAAIRDTLDRCFNEGSGAFHRFEDATKLLWQPGMMTSDYPQPRHYVEGTQRNIARSVALLKEAQRTLNEDLADVATGPSETKPFNSSAARPRKVFIVHGHDEGAREAVARFLERLDFESIILHERANRGRTIIEKIEAHGDVGFAVVLLTPDDEGCVRGGKPEPRARQNVLLELGYFLGRLRRDKICALKRGDVNIPSDFAGVVWETMDEGGGWKQALGRELDAAGFDIDWNKVMRA